MNLFLIFEKLEPVIYTSNCLTKNHYVIYLPKEWLFPVSKAIKNEVFFACNYLVEHSCIDTNDYTKYNANFNFFFKKNTKLIFSSFYFYTLKSKLTFFVDINKNDSIASIDSVYLNASWLERESSEFFNINYQNKRDMRNLLLDYSRSDYPFLKEFPSEGYHDVFFDFFEDQLQYVDSEYVEL